MIRVFISHQQADSLLAAQISQHLKFHHKISSYLDVIDPTIIRGEDLADHIRRHMSDCTQLIAVVSKATCASQWVPWEIGIATEKDYPLATYSGSGANPPEFLQKWPYLRNFEDLDNYASVSKAAEKTLKERQSMATESVQASTTISTRQFYSQLRSKLGQ